MVEKYYNENGDLGALISPGFGVGWSSWGSKNLAYDKRIIEYWLSQNPSTDEMCDFIKGLGYETVPMGGYKNLTIEYISKGTMFCICEYDGDETIETPETLGMTVA